MDNFIQIMTSHGILFPILVVLALIIFIFMIQRFVYFFVWLLLFLIVFFGALSVYDPTVGTAVKEVVWPTPKEDKSVAPMQDRLQNLWNTLLSLKSSQEQVPPQK
jgi:hypothetical protein